MYMCKPIKTQWQTILSVMTDWLNILVCKQKANFVSQFKILAAVMTDGKI